MTVLLLDFDRPQPPQLGKLCWRLRRLGLRPGWAMYRRTARGWHVALAVSERLSPLMVVATQAVMGSDRNRELFNLFRVRCLRTMPPEARQMFNVLYTRKIAVR